MRRQKDFPTMQWPLSQGRRSGDMRKVAGWCLFRSTLPARGSDTDATYLATALLVFQSTLPARGSDQNLCIYAPFVKCFNPRSPRGGATIREVTRVVTEWVFQSMLPARGSDRPRRSCLLPRPRVSIHAPREGERHQEHGGGALEYCVSIHAPREGERRWCASIP